MKTAERFACLNYGRFDILIPQASLMESTYSLTPAHSQLAQKIRCREINLDSKIASVFSISRDAEPVTEIALKTDPPIVLRTSVVPSVIQIQLSGMKIFPELFREHLKKYGILAGRFSDEKIQYLLNVSRFLESGGPS